MMHTVELDDQTASFVRQLEEQRRIEKNLMVERVRGAKEGLESVFHDIRERVEALEHQLHRADRVEPIDFRRIGRRILVQRNEHRRSRRCALQT
jgi:hypothetical protein